MNQAWTECAGALRAAEKQVCEAWRDHSQSCWAGINALALVRLKIIKKAHGTPGFHSGDFIEESIYKAPESQYEKCDYDKTNRGKRKVSTLQPDGGDSVDGD